jgi:hypothetical protein
MPDRRKGSKRKPRQTKDKVLQARIPGDLDEELRDRAATLGLSVSTIVRNVLMHTFDLVEGVVLDSTELVRAGRGGRKRPAAANSAGIEAAERPDTVVAWQQAALNLNAVCEQCNAILPKGQLAAIGIPIPARPVFLCLDCLATLAPASVPDSSGD